MKLRLDPWATEYDTAFHVEETEEVSRASIKTHLELETWQTINPREETLEFDSLIFIDGSRRTEARVLLEDDLKQVAFGAVGTFGIGAVNCCPKHSREARFIDLDVEASFTSINRICTLSGGHDAPSFDIVSDLSQKLGSLHYVVESTPEKDADAVLRRLQFKMLEAERLLASKLTSVFPDALVISDGPRPKMGLNPNVVGYLKTMHVLALGEEELKVVRDLDEGQRSPLYLVENNDKSQQLFEFFLRLRDPRPWLYSFAGMVRLQISAGSKPEERLEDAIRLANWLSILLPRFATKQHQDPRAPQQLLPVRALEAELRRKMGHSQIVRRRLTEYFSLSAD